MRAVVNGVMYILSTGCQWRYLPKDFPAHSTVHRYFVGGIATARWGKISTAARPHS
jgi:transposase